MIWVTAAKENNDILQYLETVYSVECSRQLVTSDFGLNRLALVRSKEKNRIIECGEERQLEGLECVLRPPPPIVNQSNTPHFGMTVLSHIAKLSPLSEPLRFRR